MPNTFSSYCRWDWNFTMSSQSVSTHISLSYFSFLLSYNSLSLIARPYRKIFSYFRSRRRNSITHYVGQLVRRSIGLSVRQFFGPSVRHTWLGVHSVFCSIALPQMPFCRVHATLHVALLVRPLVGPSVRLNVFEFWRDRRKERKSMYVVVCVTVKRSTQRFP